MSWYLWVFVVFLAMAVFGLGCIFARATLQKRGEHKMLSNSRANAIVGIFFTLVALAVAVDTVYLQIQFNRYVKGQVACNTSILEADAKISAERAIVDKKAADYDDTMLDYLVVHQDRFIPTEDPVYTRVKESLNDLKRERQKMVEVYAANPLPTC